MLKSLAPNMMTDKINDSVEFYTNKLGFELTMSFPETAPFKWIMLSHGEVVVMFQERESFVKELPDYSDSKIGGTFGLYISCDNVTELYNNLKSEVDVICKLAKTHYGSSEFTFKDLNGYIITLAEHSK